MNSLININNGNMNPAAKVYQYPPTTDISDGDTFVVSGKSYGNGTYSVSGSVTLVQNGSFEKPNISAGEWLGYSAMTTAQKAEFVWVGNATNSGISDNGAFALKTPYPDSTQCGYMVHGTQHFIQSIYLQAGQYTLFYWLVNKPTQVEEILVKWNGVTIATSTPSSVSIWQNFTVGITIATDGVYSLSFSGTIAIYTAGVDNVVITPTTNKVGRIFNREGQKCIFNPNSQITSTVSSTSYTGDCVDIQLPQSIYLQHYSFWQDTDSNPTSWVIAGSTDGTTWVSIHVVTSHTPTISSTYVSSQLNVSTAYNRFRFILRAGSGTYNKVSKLSYHSHL